MHDDTKQISLRDVLRHAFASLSERDACSTEPAPSTSVVAPLTRTSEDRSRMKQKVLEELSRRREQVQEAAQSTGQSRTATVPASGSSEPSLFGDVSDSDMDRPAACGNGAVALVRGPRVSHCSKMDVRDLVASAYRSLFRRLPEDHVILNSRANAEFIVRCRDLGATASEYLLNRTLLNIRKSGWNTGLVRQHVAPLSRETFDHIGHAVEIAASVVQREYDLACHAIPSVDDILCHPELRDRFGMYVSELHGAVDLVDCHLALLAFRKSGRQSAARLANVDLPERTLFAKMTSVDPDDVPEACGIYRIVCKRRPVFVSATANLRQRLLEHLEHGGEALLPEAIPFEVEGSLGVEVFDAPGSWRPRRADAVARNMRIQDYPPLNWREQGTLFAASCVVARRAAVG